MGLAATDLKWYQSSDPGSTGGVISTTLIPNNQPSGLFPQVPRIALEEGRVDYRKVFLKNVNAESLALNTPGLFILFQPTAGEEVGIALGTADDSDGSNLTYVSPSNKGNALAFDALLPDTAQAFWIRRRVNAGQNVFKTSSFQLAAFGYGPTA